MSEVSDPVVDFLILSTSSENFPLKDKDKTLRKSYESSGHTKERGRVLKKSLKIWVDIGHSPHVAFFVPIIRELEKEGHEVVITARNSFQTFDLLDLYGLKYKKIGVHYGNDKILKIYSHLIRAMRLLFFALGENFSVAASHGSQSLQIAACLLRIPQCMSCDYEPSFEPTFGKLMKVLRKVIVPEVVPDDVLLKTLKPQQIRKYPGIKEDVYVHNFRPDSGLLKALKISPKDIVVTLRPPATYAHYHSSESEKLMAGVISFALSKPGITLIFLPRTHKQKKEAIQLSKEHSGRVIVPPRVLDGLNVIWNSDLVVSGGGTMNREAAALGIPVYSIFQGPICSVDRHLEREGKLVFIESLNDIEKIRLEKREPVMQSLKKHFNLCSFLAHEIITTALDR